jgi:uncharacterized protein (TIGR02996 family)
MGDREAFVRKICEEPDEDTHRFVFADWLEESGEVAGARFIRGQFAGEEVAPPLMWLAGPLEAALGSLPHEMTRSARAGVAGAQGRHGFAVLTRGFVSYIELPTAAFLTHAEAIFRAHPVTAVRLTDKEPLSNGYETPATAWTWIRAEPGEDPARLTPWEVPHEVWGGCPATGDWFDSVGAARAWLSRRCVEFGRKAAGLPDLVGAK